MPTAFANLLPDTLSATNRGYKFTPSAEVAGGTLVYQSKSKRDFSRYWVERLPSDLPGHAFVFRKVVKAGEEQSVSETLMADRAENDLCSCRGFASTGHCKHLDVLRDLAAHDQLPAPLVDPDADAAVCDPDADVANTEHDGGLDAWADRLEAAACPWDVAGDSADRPFPPEPTMTVPGSEKRLAVVAERAKAGFRLWHPNDLPF